MIDQILETYRCLISCRKNLPGARLEDVFKRETGAVASIEAEYNWLKANCVSLQSERRVVLPISIGCPCIGCTRGSVESCLKCVVDKEAGSDESVSG